MSTSASTSVTTISADVLVAGGGAAGIGASIAAARAGAKVVLVERYGFLGGLATTAQVGTICGLYLRDTVGQEPMPVAHGIPIEFADRLQEHTRTKPIRVDPGLWVLPYSPPSFARTADAMVAEAGNIRIILHAMISEARREEARLVEVRALAWNEPLTIRASAFVDCTGEATTAALAGERVEEGATDQAPSLVFAFEDADPTLATRGLVEVRRELRMAVEKGQLPAICERISLVPGTGSNGRFAFKLSLVPAGPGKPLWELVTNWEREARALIDQLAGFLVTNIAAFRGARLDSIAPQMGVRSGRRIQGRARLKDKDVLSAIKSSGGVARGAWPMERWGDPPRPEMTYFDEKDFYDIPLDCLRVQELDNVFVAGRCLSAETRAMTSARVIGIAMATGSAAGTAAAFQAQGSSLDEAVKQIRSGLGR